MARLYDLVEIKKDSFFNGAVQAEWFYNIGKRKTVAESYIFHGPKYYGVSASDVDTKNHKLCDTVTFTNTIYKKIYDDKESSRFALTIAGYGAGKSHLSLALSTLLSNEDRGTCENILENIKAADIDGYNYINQYRDDKHLVLVLNGINDFNLNKELLKVAKQSLKLHGVSDDIFNDMSQAYKTASTFLSNTYSNSSSLYLRAASKSSKYRLCTEGNLKDTLLHDIENYDAFTIVNDVYKSIVGNDINISEGISAGLILSRLHQRFVVEEKLFKSIVIIFDEFGRYLEFASTQPGLAGEAAIQQIFESVQNAAPSMIFVGFIQSDLNAYMNRVNNDNIARYVSRYQTSDKYYLSSNLETVLSSLVKKKSKAEDIISNIFDNTLSNFSSTSQRNIIRWIPELAQKNVWNSDLMYKQTILKGCYPIHPLTLSTLATLSTYMQQRSTLTFLSDIFERYMGEEIGEKIPFIYPTALIDSPMFTELINAEERQRVPGQNCIQYKEIIEANGEVLSETDKKVLSAILIMNICKFKTYDKEDLLRAIEFVAGVRGDSLTMSINNLENRLGIIYFDVSVNRYNFMNEGNSKVDYTKLFMRKKLTVSTKDLISSLSDATRKELKLGVIEPTNFGRVNDISSGEWSFLKEMMDINDFTFDMAKSLKNSLEREIHPESVRGRVMYLYCNSESYSNVNTVAKYLKELNYDEVPAIISVVYDVNGQITNSIINLRTLNTFTSAERESFSKYIRHTVKEETQKIIRTFMECAKKKQYISEEGIVIAEGTAQMEMTKKFNSIFTKTVPFTIDGFEKKLTAKARGYFNNIVECVLQGKLEDVVEYNNLSVEVKNRVNSILSVNSQKGWKVLYDNNILSKPLQSVVNEIYEEVDKKIKSKEKIRFSELINKYTKAPYGLNIYSASLIIVYIVAMNKDNLIVYKGLNKSRVVDILSCFNDDKKEQFSEFNKYMIEYTEESEKDKVLSIVEKIEKNTGISIDEVENLYKQLNSIDQRDVSQELRGRYCSCESNLKIAVEKNIQINKDLQESKSNCDRLDKSPFSIINVLEKCNPIKDGMISGSTYRYSIKQIETAEDIKNKAVEKYKNTIIRYGELCTLDNHTNTLNIYKNRIKYFKILCEYDLVTLTEESKNIFEKRLENVKASEEYIMQATKEIGELKVDVELTRNLEQCESKINQLLIQKDKFNSSANNKLKKIVTDLETLMNKIKLIRENTVTLIEEVESIIEETTNLNKLTSSIRNIEQVLNKPMLGNTKSKISNFKEYIIDIDTTLQGFKYKRYRVEEVDTVISELSKKYSGYEKIQLLIDNIKEDLIEKVLAKDLEWKRLNIDKYDNLDGYSVSELKRIIKEASVDESYLSEDNRELLRGLNDRVNQNLSKYKIENILNIFDELSSIDKKKCISMLEDSI